MSRQLFLIVAVLFLTGFAPLVASADPQVVFWDGTTAYLWEGAGGAQPGWKLQSLTVDSVPDTNSSMLGQTFVKTGSGTYSYGGNGFELKSTGSSGHASFGGAPAIFETSNNGQSLQIGAAASATSPRPTSLAWKKSGLHALYEFVMVESSGGSGKVTKYGPIHEVLPGVPQGAIAAACRYTSNGRDTVDVVSSSQFTIRVDLSSLSGDKKLGVAQRYSGFSGGTVTALVANNDRDPKIFIFTGDRYDVYDTRAGRVTESDQDFNRTFSNVPSGVTSVDAALNAGSLGTWLFSGDHCMQCDLDQRRMIGSPMKVSQAFPDMKDVNIKAACLFKD